MGFSVKEWQESILNSSVKKAMPILSFPAVKEMGISVKELISNSEKQATAMKIVADKTDAMASVSLMDLSVEAECFGAKVRFFDDEVPTVLGAIVSSEDEADSLVVPKVGEKRSGIYIDAIKKAVKLIKDRPVFAGMIGPFSLAARLLDVTEIMILCYDEPDMVHTVLEKATSFLIDYAKEYKRAGANGVVIAEPVAGLLSPKLATEFSSKYFKSIVDAVSCDTFAVIYHNCGGNVIKAIDGILQTNSSAYHFGNAIDMEELMGKIPSNVIAMGNVDPATEFANGTIESVKKATKLVLEKCSKYPNFVISSGCDIPPKTSWENIDAFFEAVDEFYGKN